MAQILSIVANPDAGEPDLRSVPNLLRNIAAEIEEGGYGIKEYPGSDCICRGALVLRISGQNPVVFGLGDTDPSQTFMDFHAGAQELMAMSHPGR